MRAIVITKPGGPEVLTLADREPPVCGPTEVRVRVRAAGLNRADVIQRRGAYPAPPGVPADVPGMEYAGEVIEVGAEAAGFEARLQPGDRVFGLVGGGAYAEEIVVDARTAARIPARLSFVEAAAVPEAFITAFDAMVVQGCLGRGDVALIHAAGSGVGTAATQIARAIGARAIGTSRSQPKLDRCRPLGLSDGIVTQDARFAKEVLALTEGRGVDVVLDLVGGAYVPEDLACAALRSRILVVGLIGGAKADLDLGLLLRKRAQLIGTTLRARGLEEKIGVMDTFSREVVPRLTSGELGPVIDAVLPLAQAREAHVRMESNDPFGKIVLDV